MSLSFARLGHGHAHQGLRLKLGLSHLKIVSLLEFESATESHKSPTFTANYRTNDATLNDTVMHLIKVDHTLMTKCCT